MVLGDVSKALTKGATGVGEIVYRQHFVLLEEFFYVKRLGRVVSVF